AELSFSRSTARWLYWDIRSGFYATSRVAPRATAGRAHPPRRAPPTGAPRLLVELVLASPVDVVAQRRLTRLLEQERPEDEAVHLGPHEAQPRMARRADDRLAADVEGRVHEDRAAGELLEAREEGVVEGVRLGVHRLDARRVVDVRDRRDRGP